MKNINSVYFILLLFSENWCIISREMGGMVMEPKDYIVKRIEGEYCYLENTETGEEVFIALALLPVNIDIGTRIHEEMFQYSIAD